MSKYLTNERIFVYPCLSFIVAMVWYGMVHIPFKEGHHHHHQYHQLFIGHSMTHSFVFEKFLLRTTENITQAAQHDTTLTSIQIVSQTFVSISTEAPYQFHF